MNGNSRQGFVLSILLHVLLAGAALVFAFINPPEEPERTVFELVSAPPPMSAVMPVEQSSVDFTMPEVPPPPPVVPIPIPEPEPEPQPVVPVNRPEPKPRPKPPEPKKVEPAPTMSYAEFLKQHGAPKTPAKKKPAPKPVSVPRLNTSFTANIPDVVINLDSLTHFSDAELSALDRYIARLKEQLRQAWDKPTELAESLATTVEFHVAGNGKLSGVRVTSSSGNRQFDESVTRAFATLDNAGATPNRKTQHLRLRFRMTDQ
ncbi:MAG: energy transducer TonB [Opitutaceae bacterium]